MQIYASTSTNFSGEGDLLDFVDKLLGSNSNIIEEVAEENDIAIEEFTNEAKYSCAICHKKYKTKTWLVKHTESKHQQNGAETQLRTKLEVEIIFKLLMEAQKNISKDECYSTLIRSTVENYIFVDKTELLTNEIQKQLYSSLCSNSDAEKFYSQFYQLIVMDAKKKIHKFTNWRSTNAQDLLTLLYAAKSDDVSSQKLISCQTRGGLWAVTAECLQVFKIVEEEFRKKTSAVHVTKIDSSKISEALLQRIDMVSAYDSMTHGFTTTISKETRFCLLDKTIKLFLRVRAFSYVKDKTKLQACKNKALRKDIKKRSENNAETH
ncbi:PREDICTED: uncharacterized protein LOC105845497 [Paramuricea clavata]|uniref:PREDICTED: uncharacterized protein LOC105845497 n=1 Tax=Paramuricea clavata TaxID=317549 RepID=A0A7D9HFF4_PARCT|nr:PREDICTED: uncharacterized protein LOC105845497 [Paramuricea clavata]